MNDEPPRDQTVESGARTTRWSRHSPLPLRRRWSSRPIGSRPSRPAVMAAAEAGSSAPRRRRCSVATVAAIRATHPWEVLPLGGRGRDHRRARRVGRSSSWWARTTRCAIAAADRVVVEFPDGDSIVGEAGVELPDGTRLDVIGFVEIDGHAVSALGSYAIVDGAVVADDRPDMSGDLDDHDSTGSVAVVDGDDGSTRTTVPARDGCRQRCGGGRPVDRHGWRRPTRRCRRR